MDIKKKEYAIGKKKSSKPIRIKSKELYDFYLTAYFHFEKNLDIINNINNICKWGNDDDADDFLSMVIEGLSNPNFYYMNYRIANFFFRLFINSSANFNDIEKPLFLNELIEEIKNRYDDEETQITVFKSVLILIKKSLLKLINSFNRYLISIHDFFEKTKDINKNIPNNIILYRGFNIHFNKEIITDINHQIKENPNNIIIKSVLSTSISEKVAFRFLGIGEKGIIWKIIVPQNKYTEFKYSFLKKNYPDNPSISTIAKIDNEHLSSKMDEYEFLLNYGLKLKFIEIKEEIRRINRGDVDVNMTLNIYVFEFLGYDLSDLINFDTRISRIITDIDDI